MVAIESYTLYDLRMKQIPRLSDKEFAALELLVNRGEMYGLEMVKASGGVLKRGTIYVMLSRMGDKGYVTSRQDKEEGLAGMPRRKFRVAGLGVRAYHASQAAAAIFSGTKALA